MRKVELRQCWIIESTYDPLNHNDTGQGGYVAG